MSVELNGVANIHMIIQNMEMELEDGNTDALAGNIQQIRNELDTLNRYITEIGRQVKYSKDVKIPFWHEVRANKSKYKTNKGT